MISVVFGGTRFVPRSAGFESRLAYLLAIATGLIGGLYLIDVLVLQLFLLLSLTVVGLTDSRVIAFLIPASIPFIYQPVILNTWQFNLSELLVVVLGISIITSIPVLAWTRTLRHRAQIAYENVARSSATVILVTALTGVGVLSLIPITGAETFPEALRQFRWVALIPAIFIVLVSGILSRLESRWLAYSFLAGVTLLAVHALISVGYGAAVAADGVTRATGLTPHPNVLAMILERAAAFAVVWGILDRERRWLLVPAAVMVGTLALTFSRGGWAGFGLATVLLIALSGRRRDALILAGVGILATVAGMVAYGDRVLALLGGSSGSLRISIWQSSVEMVRDNFWSGVGLDQFLYQYTPRYIQPEAWNERFTSHPHQLILDTWLNLGIMGLLLAAAIGIILIRWTLRGLRQQDAMTMGLAGALLAGLIHGQVDNSYFLPDLALMFWLFVFLMERQSRATFRSTVDGGQQCRSSWQERQDSSAPTSATI